MLHPIQIGNETRNINQFFGDGSMRAAWYERNGAAGDVLNTGEVERPQAGSGEVLVRLHVSGVNPSDVRSRRIQALAFPRIIPHNDGAGVIEAVGEGVPAARVGERVWIWNGQWQRASGTAADFVALPAHQAVPLPDSVSFAEGACLGVPALTALHGVRLLGDIAGKFVLVTGAGASVGNYATQFAVRRGAIVIGTASGERADHARLAGARHVIDYRSENVVERTRELTGGAGAHCIIDIDFSSTALMLSQGILRHNGVMACYGSNNRGDVAVPFAMLPFYAVTMRFYGVYGLTPEDKAAAVDELQGMLAGDVPLIHTVGRRFRFGEVVAAHEAVEAGRTVGNIVIDMVDA